MTWVRRLVPASIRALRWRLPWMLATDSYARAPVRTILRAMRFTLAESAGRDVAFQSPDGLSITTMANNFSSFAFCVDGARDAAIWRFVKRHIGQGGVFIDAGANIGTYALPAALLVGASGRVIAFEAHPITFSYLHRNARTNGLTQLVPLHLALGETNGEVSMTFFAANPGETHVASAGETVMANTAVVPLRRLDDALAEQGVTRVDYLKVDVEGFELPVLRGALRTLTDNPGIAVQTELVERHAARYGHRIEDIGSLMSGIGLRPHLVDDRTGTLEPLTGKLAGDVIWVRPPGR